MKVIAIIQARMSSTRLPGKVLMKFGNETILDLIIKRLSFSKQINEIVVATTFNKLDDIIVKHCESRNIKFTRGSETNVLERFFEAAKSLEADIIVRVTSDDPFKDPKIIDNCVELLINNNLDFCSNNNPPSFPEGLDVEVFSMKSLEIAYKDATSDFDKEHVTQFFYKNPTIFKQMNLSYFEDLSYIRLTLDTNEDFEFLSLIYTKLQDETSFLSFEKIVDFLKSYPEYLKINSFVQRSQMYKK